MKKVFIICGLLILAIIFGSCGDAPVAELDSWDGRETVITEEIIEESVITWDNVPMETWD